MKKTIYYRFSITLAVFMFFTFLVTAQTGTLKGMVTDKITNEPVSYGTIILLNNGKMIKGTISDDNGNYYFNNVIPGIYELKAELTGYNTSSYSNVEIKEDKITYKDINIEERLTFLSNPSFKPLLPLISKTPVPSGQSYNAEEIKRMAW